MSTWREWAPYLMVPVGVVSACFHFAAGQDGFAWVLVVLTVLLTLILVAQIIVWENRRYWQRRLQQSAPGGTESREGP
jgi:hypothetical protein